MPIIELENIEKKKIMPGHKVRFVHTDNITIAYWEVKAGSMLPKHSHIHEQISQLTAGEFELTIEDKTYMLGKGEIAVIPSNTEHSGRAVTDCTIMDIFYPVREDYR